MLLMQVCLVGEDGYAILRRIQPLYDPVAAEQEALEICKVRLISRQCHIPGCQPTLTPFNERCQ